MDAQLLGIGQASAVTEAAEDKQPWVGRLLVPEPEQPHGWGSYYVSRQSETPVRRRLGFNR